MGFVLLARFLNNMATEDFCLRFFFFLYRDYEIMDLIHDATDLSTIKQSVLAYHIKQLKNHLIKDFKV